MSEGGGSRPVGNPPTSAPGSAGGAGSAPSSGEEHLWNELRQKEHTILVLQKKLAHFRSWVTSVHGRVQQVNPQAIKNSRRLYVGGLPLDASEDDLKQFFQGLMAKTGALASPGMAVLSVKITPEKGFGFVEFRSVEETSNAMAFDGVAYKDTYLKIRRPSNYDPSTAIMLGPMNPDPTMDTSTLDICRTLVEDSPHKLFVGGLPCEWNEDQVKEMLLPYGLLKSFNLVMDKATGKSKGYAFCEYADEATADMVIRSLNLKRVGNKSLTVKRALEGGMPGPGGGSGGGASGSGKGSGGGGGTLSGSMSPTGTSPGGTPSLISKLASLGGPITPTPSGSLGGPGTSPLGPDTPANLQGAISALLQAQAQASTPQQQALAQQRAALGGAMARLVQGHAAGMQASELAAAAEELAAAAVRQQQAQGQQDPNSGSLMTLHSLW